MNRLVATLLVILGFSSALHAEDWKPEPGFISLFNGTDLTGWCFREKAGKNDPKPGAILAKHDGKTQAADAGRYMELKQYKPQEWNQIEVVVKEGVARCTCNGEVLEAALALPANGPIGLEGDRGVMEYRRIRIKELP